jgi:hypothetical protein
VAELAVARAAELDAMHTTPTTRRFISVILLLLLPLQALAIVSLPCRHALLAAPAHAVHPCHGATAPLETAGDGGAAGLFVCQTCTLASVMGSFALARAVGDGAPAPDAEPAPVPRYFYRFLPEPPQRPPIPAQV